jgi:prepilin peptidase CpaA
MNELASTGTWLSSGGWQAVSLVVLVVLLVGAAVVDVREHRIPNALVFPGIAVALLLAHLPGGSLSGSLAGIAVGLAMGLPLYWLRAMGAGDVKLLGMVGAFLGGSDTFVATLVIFAVGGVLGLVAVARRRAFAQLGANLKQMTFGGLVNTMTSAGPAIDAPARSVGVQPYGVAIAAGTVLYIALAKGGIFQ